jgi:serine protease AprX
MKFNMFFLLVILGSAGFALESRAVSTAAVDSVVVVMKDQADLSGAQSITTKAEKGKFVYQALKSMATKGQTGVKQVLDAKGVKYHSYYIMNMLQVYSNDPKLIEVLSARSDVKAVISNAPKRFVLPQSHPDDSAKKKFAAAENIVAVGADRVWSQLKVTGSGITVAGQDTGIDWMHPVLKNTYRGIQNGKENHDYNWHDAIREPLQEAENTCGYSSQIPCDDNEHGTHTIATVAGGDGNMNQIGMAPGANWMGCRNMDAGMGQFTTYLECFEFFLAPYPRNGDSFLNGDPLQSPHVINNSWGCTPEEGCEGWELEKAVAAVTAAGILVVASAGNEGPGCGTIMHPPATFGTSTLSVGALDHRNGRLAYFSSRGPSKFDGSMGPDVSAPGVEVRSAVPGGQYASMSGTSMAGPHVVGLAALIMSAQPALIGQPEAVSEIIRKTATPKKTTENCGGVSGQLIPNNSYGFGAIDAFKAVQLAIGAKQ